MKKSWAVTLTVEVEYQYLPNQFGLMTVIDERLIEGDDEFCDALWAAEQTKLFLRDRINANGSQTVFHVIKIDVKEAE